MHLQLRIVKKLKRQIAVVSFVEEILELLEKESSPVVHLNCNENMRKMRKKKDQEKLKKSQNLMPCKMRLVDEIRFGGRIRKSESLDDGLNVGTIGDI